MLNNNQKRRMEKYIEQYTGVRTNEITSEAWARIILDLLVHPEIGALNECTIAPIKRVVELCEKTVVNGRQPVSEWKAAQEVCESWHLKTAALVDTKELKLCRMGAFIAGMGLGTETPVNISILKVHAEILSEKCGSLDNATRLQLSYIVRVVGPRVRVQEVDI